MHPVMINRTQIPLNSWQSCERVSVQHVMCLPSHPGLTRGGGGGGHSSLAIWVLVYVDFLEGCMKLHGWPLRRRLREGRSVERGLLTLYPFAPLESCIL